MSVQGIHPYERTDPFFDPWSARDPSRECVDASCNRAKPNRNLDTIEDAKNAYAFLFPDAVGSLVANAEPSPTRPKLEAPLFDTDKLPSISQELSHLIPHTQKKEGSDTLQEDTNTAEHTLLMLLVNCMKTQRNHREKDDLLNYETVRKGQEANKVVMEKHFDQQHEILARSKTSTVLGWVSWIFWGGLMAAGVASIALSIATGGAALPAVLIAATAFSAVGSGVVTIIKGILDYQNNRSKGKLNEIEFERFMNTDIIKKAMSEIKQSMEVISEIWKHLREVFDNLLVAAINK